MKNYDEIFLNQWRNNSLYRLFIRILLVGFVLIVLAFITSIIFYQSKGGKSLSIKTYEASFSGEIVSIRRSKGDALVKINNEENKIFLKHSYNHSGSRVLHEFLKEGDIIIKKDFSDSLIVQRDGVEYVFILGYIPSVRGYSP